MDWLWLWNAKAEILLLLPLTSLTPFPSTKLALCSTLYPTSSSYASASIDYLLDAGAHKYFLSTHSSSYFSFLLIGSPITNTLDSSPCKHHLLLPRFMCSCVSISSYYPRVQLSSCSNAPFNLFTLFTFFPTTSRSSDHFLWLTQAIGTHTTTDFQPQNYLER